MSFWAQIIAADGCLDERSYYNLLGVEDAAEPAQLIAQYYKLAAGFHPDRYAVDGSKEGMAALNRVYARLGEAKRVLLDPELRAQYDKGLTAGVYRLQQPFKTARKSGTQDPAGTMARSLYERATRKLSEGALVSARADLELAKQFEPNSFAIEEAIADLAGREEEEDGRGTEMPPKRFSTRAETSVIETSSDESQATLRLERPIADAGVKETPVVTGVEAGDGTNNSELSLAKETAELSQQLAEISELLGTEASESRDRGVKEQERSMERDSVQSRREQPSTTKTTSKKFVEYEKVRTDVRHRRVLPVRIRVPTWEQLEVLYTRDISRGGMFLKTKQVLPVKSRTRLVLRIPSGDTIELEAEVVHLQKEGIEGMGLRFLQMKPEVMLRLETLLGDAKEESSEAEEDESSRGKARNPLAGKAPTKSESSYVPKKYNLDEPEGCALLEKLVAKLISLKSQSPREILGVEEDATKLEVRQAYEELVREFHPRRNAATRNPERMRVCRELVDLVRQAYESV